MMNNKTLIDKAAKMCGGVNELAEKIDVHPSQVSMLKTKRKLSPEIAAIIAAAAGEDPREAALGAIVERAKGTKREGILRELLTKKVSRVKGQMVLNFRRPVSLASDVTMGEVPHTPGEGLLAMH